MAGTEKPLSVPEAHAKLVKIMTEGFAKIDDKLVKMEASITDVDARLKTLDNSINQTIDDAKPSLRMQVSLLKMDMDRIKGLSGKLSTLFVMTPVTVLVGYAMVQLFGPGHTPK